MSAADQKRNRSRISAAIFWVALLGVVLVAFAIKHRQAGRKAVPNSITQAALTASNRPAGPVPAARPETERVTARSERFPPLKPSLPASTAPPQSVGSSPIARQLLTGLTQINSAGGVTPQKAEELKRSFKQLTEQGNAAVPAIREYLERLQDIDLDAIGAGKRVGYVSVRIGLLDVLGQIGGPEALAALHQTLQTTADPSEIAVLARNLDVLARANTVRRLWTPRARPWPRPRPANWAGVTWAHYSRCCKRMAMAQSCPIWKRRCLNGDSTPRSLWPAFPTALAFLP